MASPRKKTAGKAPWPVQPGKTTLVTARGFASVAETPDDPPDLVPTSSLGVSKKPASKPSKVVVKPAGDASVDPGQVKSWVEGLIRQALGPSLTGAERKVKSKLNVVLDPRTLQLLTTALQPASPKRAKR